MTFNPLAVPTLLVAAFLFWVGFVLARGLRQRPAKLLAIAIATIFAVPALLMSSYYVHLFDDAAWYYNLRTVPYCELTASGAGLLAGLLQGWLEPDTTGSRLIVPTVLFCVVFTPFVKSVLDPVDIQQLSRECVGEVCLQSTPSTCGPNSAATLLKLFGQKASERELSRESFTSRGGTEIWYLARALQRRGLHTQVVIQPARQPVLVAPAIAGVILPGGAGHFIAVLQNADGQVVLGDPLRGKIILTSPQALRAYQFTGFFLEVTSLQK